MPSRKLLIRGTISAIGLLHYLSYDTFNPPSSLYFQRKKVLFEYRPRQVIWSSENGFTSMHEVWHHPPLSLYAFFFKIFHKELIHLIISRVVSFLLLCFPYISQNFSWRITCMWKKPQRTRVLQFQRPFIGLEILFSLCEGL